MIKCKIRPTGWRINLHNIQDPKSCFKVTFIYVFRSAVLKFWTFEMNIPKTKAKCYADIKLNVWHIGPLAFSWKSFAIGLTINKQKVKYYRRQSENILYVKVAIAKSTHSQNLFLLPVGVWRHVVVFAEPSARTVYKHTNLRLFFQELFNFSF